MTSPEFSVLLLAWDEADPGVVVLGGPALPPTLSLVYQLASQHPVVALYPHLPAPAAGEPAAEAAPQAIQATFTKPKAASSKSIAPTEKAPAAGPGRPPAPAPDALHTPVASAGVRLLAAPVPAPPSVPAPPAAAAGATLAPLSSRLIGLEDLSPAPKASPQRMASLFAAVPGIPVVPPRSQWPATRLSATGQWVAPAAPYAGASAELEAEILPTAPASVALGFRKPAPALPHPPPPPAPPAPPRAHSLAATLRPNLHPLAGDLSFDPDPELPAVQRPAIFGEATEAPGTAEAAALSAPEDDLTLAEAEANSGTPNPTPAPVVAGITAVPAAPMPAPALPAPALAKLVPQQPVLDGLNFRMIQYARRAAQLVRGRSDFGVIYAPNWPAWLAALEIRYHTGQPLVLYAASLAASFAPTTEHGWLLEVERMALRRAHLILVPTEALRQQLRARYGSTIGEVRVVAAHDEAAVHAVLREVAQVPLAAV